MPRRLLIAIALWCSLVIATVLGLWLGGSCAMIRKHRPPVMLHLGGVYRPQAPDHEPWNAYGRVTVPTRPIGVWADVLYDTGHTEVVSTTFGFSILFPAEPQPSEELDELILEDFAPQLPPPTR